MTQPTFNWKQPAGKALEAALNRALALDPETRAALAALHGQRVALTLTSPPLALQVRVDGDALRRGALARLGIVGHFDGKDAGARCDWKMRARAETKTRRFPCLVEHILMVQ